MQAIYYTNKGPSRTANQDGLYVAGRKYTEMDQPEVLTLVGSNALFAVIDGMGGAKGGEVATQMLLKALEEANQSGVASCQDIEKTLIDAANNMRKAAQHNVDLAEMGAVIAGIAIRDDSALVFNCGDSRAYKLHAGHLQKLTHDHSLVQTLYDLGRIDEDAMRTHKIKRVVTSSIGATADPIEVFCLEQPVQKGDIFFLCSDGIWEILPHTELEHFFANGPCNAAEQLVKAVFAAPAKDNISFIMLYL